MNSTTNVTNSLAAKGYPIVYVSPYYFEALNEASNFIREHSNENILSKESFMDIVKKAIGPMPPINGKLSSNEVNFLQINYHKSEDLFVKRALVFSR